MGYRNKIALLSIEQYEKIKDQTYDQIKADHGSDYVGCYKLSKEVYEIGKYWDSSFLDPHKKNIFSNPDTHERYNDEGEFVIIGKEGLLVIIESYRQKVIDYYKSILNPSAQDVEFGWNTTPEKVIETKIREWENGYVKPYNLDLKSDELVSAWNFEYTIFDLVRIYKTTDDSKFLICLTGW